MEAGGMEDLGTLGGPESAAYGVSADGLVVVGYAVNKDGYARAFRWTVAGGMRDLGTLGGDESHAYDVSKDGSVVVGWTQKKDGLYESLFHRAFRWTLEGGMQDLGTIGNANWTEAHGVSADGSVVVGWAGFFASGEVRNVRAFRWTMMRGMQNLGTPLGAILSWAHSVSADGSAVVGWGEDELRRARAFRWTQAGGMRDLGTLPTTFDEIKIWRGWAYGVSADGSVVVGLAKDVVGGEQRAFRWTQAGGMEDLNRTYASLLSDGSRLEEARAISPDARYIVGRGYNGKMNRKEAFLLDTGGNRQ
jgi:probable HAF family extracellular repeat protein